jgi:hypothetical protein
MQAPLVAGWYREAAFIRSPAEKASGAAARPRVLDRSATEG